MAGDQRENVVVWSDLLLLMDQAVRFLRLQPPNQIAVFLQTGRDALVTVTRSSFQTGFGVNKPVPWSALGF